MQLIAQSANADYRPRRLQPVIFRILEFVGDYIVGLGIVQQQVGLAPIGRRKGPFRIFRFLAQGKAGRADRGQRAAGIQRLQPEPGIQFPAAILKDGLIRPLGNLEIDGLIPPVIFPIHIVKAGIGRLKDQAIDDHRPNLRHGK